MVCFIRLPMDPDGATRSDVGSPFCGGVCQRSLTFIPVSRSTASLRGQHRSARPAGTALVGFVDAWQRHLRSHGQFWFAARTVWESPLGSLVGPSLEGDEHQPSKSASLNQLDLWTLCLNVFDA